MADYYGTKIEFGNVNIAEKKRILSFIINEEGEVDFDVLMPVPDGIDNTDWRGTRSNLFGSGKNKNPFEYIVNPYDSNDGTLVVYIISAWCSPYKWIEKLAEAVDRPMRVFTGIDYSELRNCCLETFYNKGEELFCSRMRDIDYKDICELLESY